MRKIAILNSTFRVLFALFLVGLFSFQTLIQGKKVVAWTDEADNVVTYLMRKET